MLSSGALASPTTCPLTIVRHAPPSGRCPGGSWQPYRSVDARSDGTAASLPPSLDCAGLEPQAPTTKGVINSNIHFMGGPYHFRLVRAERPHLDEAQVEEQLAAGDYRPAVLRLVV